MKKYYTGHKDIVTSLSLIDFKRFISCSGDRLAKIWDIESSMCLGSLIGMISYISF